MAQPLHVYEEAVGFLPLDEGLKPCILQLFQEIYQNPFWPFFYLQQLGCCRFGILFILPL
jgi:hypothetical protein